MAENPTESDALAESLSEPSTYKVKEVPTWHGQPVTPRSASTSAPSVSTPATAPQNTPATITSAPSTPLAEGGCNPPAGPPLVLRAQRYTVQALDRDGALVTSTNWHKTQQAAEESAARLVRVNGALCWIVQREEVTTLGEWTPLPAIGGEL